MKREKFLWPLTQGHHRGLVAAKNIKNRINQMGVETQEKEMTDLRAEVTQFWEGDLKAHFKAEEKMLEIFEAHTGPADKDVARILSDHRTMEQLMKKGFKEDLLRLADLLTQHIHYEEDVLFGRIEKTLTPAEVRREAEMLLNEAVPTCVNLPKPGK